MTRRILLVALLLSASFTFAQAYGTVEGQPHGPFFGPILTPPIVELPSPTEPTGVMDYGPLAPVSPLVSVPVLGFGWTSTFTGASNGTPGNQVGARNSTLESMYGSWSPAPAPAGGGALYRGSARFNTGAAFYTPVSYGDHRSLGEVAAGLRRETKTTSPRVYTNDDISHLKQPQEGSTLGPQTVTPTPSNPNLPQGQKK